jgi:CheY-like chemotaxis protein
LLKGIYIDDSPEDREIYAGLLSGERFQFEQYQPGSIKDLKSFVAEFKPDIIAMDYRLDGVMGDTQENHYRAGTPAQALREMMSEQKDKDFPIVLVSTEKNIHELFGPDKTSHDLFDEKYLKDYISSGECTEEIDLSLQSLCDAYQTIRENLTSDRLHEILLDIDQDYWDQVRPKGLLASLLETDHVPHAIARLFMRQIIMRSGLLLSAKDVAARLGAEPDQGDELIAYFSGQGMGYSGILSEGWARIWSNRLNIWASEIFQKSLASVPGVDRVTTLAGLIGHALVPAVSKWTGKSDERFVFSCAACDYPTELTNSVSIFDPHCPAFGERKRACFDCVVKRGPLDRRRLQIDESDSDLAQQLRDGRIVRP